MDDAQGWAGKYLTGERPNLWHRLMGLFNPAVITRQVQFSDVSFYQGVINWDTMRTKSQAVIIRAGQRYWPDSQFPRNWAEARRVGMKRGAYWFYDDRENPVSQAQLLAASIGSDRPEMEIFIDYELVYGGSFQGLGNVVAMMQQVENLLPGAQVGIYTGYYFFNAHADQKYFDYLRNKALWEAWYTTDPDNVRIPQPWSKLTHWQWGTPAVGSEWGVASGNIDMNYYNGTALEFNTAYGGTVSPPPPPEPPPAPTQKGLVTAGALNVRSGPGVSYPAIGIMLQNESAYGNVDPGTNWMRISKIERLGGEIEVIDGWSNASYMQVSNITEPPNGGNMQMINYANGVTEFRDYLYGSSIRILIVPSAAIKSAAFYQPKTGSKCDYAQNVDGDLVFNFTPFNTANCFPNLGLRIGGATISPYINYNPWAAWSPNYNPWAAWSPNFNLVISHPKSSFNSFSNVSQAFRYIIEKGIKNANSGGSAWENLEPRRLLAATQGGATVIISAAGRDIDERGLSLHEAAELCLTHDAFHADPIYMAIDGDSGSSVQDYLKIGAEKTIFLGVPPGDQGAVAVFGVIKFNQPIPGDVPIPTPDVYIDPITVHIDGATYRSVGDKIPLEKIG